MENLNFFKEKMLTELSMDIIDVDEWLYRVTHNFYYWIGFVVFCAVLFILFGCLVVHIYYKTKRKKKYNRGQISKSIGDEVGKYNLDTIDNYEDTKKKLQIERREIEISKEIKNVDPAFSIVKFKSDVCKTFLNMQKYWTEENLDEIRDLETDELYEQHKRILEDFSRKHQKNVRENVSIEGCFLNDFSRSKDKENIIVDYVVKMKDYIVEDGIEPKAKKKILQTYLYRTTFVRALGVKTNEDFEPGEVVKCPNCGADVRVSVSEYCPYCNSIITSKKYGWVISNIEKTIIRDSQI